MNWYVLLILAVGLERLAELVVAQRNAKRAFARGAVETGRSHYPVMVVLHSGLLIACLVEVAAFDRPFIPLLGWTAFALVVFAQALRWWCIRTLGDQWNTRIIVIPGAGAVTSGPYRWMAHPNYVAVIVEVAALPLVHTAWLTALVFSLANAVLLFAWRIPAEAKALEALEPGRAS